jgi:hypothetical protein
MSAVNTYYELQGDANRDCIALAIYMKDGVLRG